MTVHHDDTVTFQALTSLSSWYMLFKYAVPKTGNDNKRPQATMNHQKMTINYHKPPANDHKRPQTTSKRPQINSKRPQ